jgi:hypothetical protein
LNVMGLGMPELHVDVRLGSPEERVGLREGKDRQLLTLEVEGIARVLVVDEVTEALGKQTELSGDAPRASPHREVDPQPGLAPQIVITDLVGKGRDVRTVGIQLLRRRQAGGPGERGTEGPGSARLPDDSGRAGEPGQAPIAQRGVR